MELTVDGDGHYMAPIDGAEKIEVWVCLPNGEVLYTLEIDFKNRAARGDWL